MTRSAAVVRTSLATQPAPWFITALGTVAALISAFAHLNPTASAVVFSLATAIGTVVTAFMTRPVAVSVISGAAAVILGDLALFGLHLTSDETGAVVGVVTFALGAFLHLAHIQYTAAQAVRTAQFSVPAVGTLPLGGPAVPVSGLDLPSGPGSTAASPVQPPLA